MPVPKKVEERIKKYLPKFQKVLESAKLRDINESDTVQLITDMLEEVFGFAKFVEITSELQIRGTYCDLAIKIEGKFPYLIEVKAIGTELKDKHKKQAIDYGANKGIVWIILTNGLHWNVYRIRFEQPINYDLVFSLDICALSAKSPKDLEMLFMLSKEALGKNLKEEYYAKVQNVNRYIIGNMLLTDAFTGLLKRELKRFSEGTKIESEEIFEILQNEVLKRDIVEGDEAEEAKKRIKKFLKQTEKIKASSQAAKLSSSTEIATEEPLNVGITEEKLPIE
jgi:hypothetical protein